jgi:hypothetical protein
MLNVLLRIVSAEEYNGVKQVSKGKTCRRMGKGCTNARGGNEKPYAAPNDASQLKLTDAAVVVLYKAICQERVI